MSINTTPRYRVKTAKTIFTIVERLNEANGMTLSELARAIDVAPATAHNHLKTLEEFGYLEEEDGEYYVGLKFLHHGMDALRRHRVWEVSQDALENLAEETEEIVWLVTECRGKTIALNKSLGDRAVQTDGFVGQPANMHCTASGKAILADFPRERVVEIIDRHGLPARTPHTITDRDELLDELQAVQEQGYGINDEESVLGARSVACTVADEATVYGAISVTGPTHRMSDERIESELAEDLLGTANEITLRMNYLAG